MHSPKMVVMVDGWIGLQIVSFLANACPSNLAGLVVMKTRNEITEFAEGLQPPIPIALWRGQGDPELRQWLNRIAPEIVLLAWWPAVVRNEIECGQLVTLNMHPSLLPYGRGKDPNFWALVEQQPFGVSIHHVVGNVDAGPIAFQREIAFDWTDTGQSLYQKAFEELFSLFRECLPRITKLDIPSFEQNLSIGRTRRRAELDPRSFVALDEPTTPRALLNLLRARTYPPYPACRFRDGDKTYEVRVAITEVADRYEKR